MNVSVCVDSDKSPWGLMVLALKCEYAGNHWGMCMSCIITANSINL